MIQFLVCNPAAETTSLAVQNGHSFSYNSILNTLRKLKLTHNMQIIGTLKHHIDLHCNCSITDNNGNCMSTSTY